MNFITITGNLGKNSELRTLPDGTSVLNFSIADNQGKDKPAIWWDASLFGKRAESLQQYMTKGQQVTVVGQVSEREFTDKSGNQKKAFSVRVAEIALQGARADGNGHQQQEHSAKPLPIAGKHAPALKAQAPVDDPDFDVPF